MKRRLERVASNGVPNRLPVFEQRRLLQPPSIVFLQTNRVKPCAQSQYLKNFVLPLSYLLPHRFRAWTTSTWDQVLPEFMDFLRENGHHSRPPLAPAVVLAVAHTTVTKGQVKGMCIVLLFESYLRA